MARRLLRDYGLGWAYLLGWLLTWGLHAALTYATSEMHAPHAAPWWLEWLETSFENLASEWHQVGAFILLSKYLYFRGSPQSKEVEP